MVVSNIFLIFTSTWRRFPFWRGWNHQLVNIWRDFPTLLDELNYRDRNWMLSGMSTDKVKMSDDSMASLYTPLTRSKIHLETILPECSNEESSDVLQELRHLPEKKRFPRFVWSKRRQEKIKSWGLLFQHLSSVVAKFGWILGDTFCCNLELGGGDITDFLGIFTPETWGRWTYFDNAHMFQMGWNVQPPPEQRYMMNHAWDFISTLWSFCSLVFLGNALKTNF